jgi:uncharacterized protein involved in outer membrane biogenesis
MAKRFLLLLVVVGLILVAALFVVTHRALAPGILRPIAESELSQVLGRPVTVGELDIDLFPRPQVRGGEVTVSGGAAQAAPSLRLRAVRIVPRLASLFSGRLAIEVVELDGLVLAVRRDGNGRWYLPFGALPSAAPQSGAQPTPARPGHPPQAPAAGVPSAGKAGQSGPAVEVGEVRLANGRVTVVDDVLRSQAGSAEVAALTDIAAHVETRSGELLLNGLTAKLGASRLTGSGRFGEAGLRMSLSWDALAAADLPQAFGLVGSAPVPGLTLQGKRPLDVELSVSSAGTVNAKGTVRADRLALDTLTITSVEAPFTFNGSRLTADPVVCRAYGGAQRGRFRVTLGPPVAWSLVGRVEHLDVNAFLSANTSAKDRLSATGQLDLNLRAAGAPLERALTGTLAARLVKGVIHDFPLLAAINQALGVTGGGGRDTAFEELSATLAVGGGKASTRNLLLKMGELTVSAAGVLGFDQRLDLEGQVTLSPARTAGLTGKAGELRNLRNDRGELEIPLTVTGTVSAPSINVDLARMLETAAKYQLKLQLEKTLKRFIKN